MYCAECGFIITNTNEKLSLPNLYSPPAAPGNWAAFFFSPGGSKVTIT